MMEQKSAFQDRKEGFHFRCEACGGALVYDIQKNAQNMRCTSCGRTISCGRVTDSLVNTENAKEPDTLEALEYRCPSCGAALYTTQTNATSFCSYCGSNVVLQERVSHMLRPSRIVPFRVTREECEQIYRNRLSESRFVPEDMLSQETISHFRPVYVPFWRYSGSGDGTSEGLSTESYTGSDNYRYTDTYRMVLDNHMSINSVLYDASSQFDDETAQDLNFSTDRMVPFRRAYLAGLYAEAPDLDPKACYSWLHRKAWRLFSDRMQEKRVCNVASFPPNFKEEAELVLMPVWLLAARQGDTVIYTAVNGDSGAIRCDLPVSPRRVWNAAGAVALLLAAVILALHHFVLLRPRITAALSCVLAMICWDVIGPFLNRLSRKNQQEDDLTRLMKSRSSRTGKKDLNPDDLPEPGELKPIIPLQWIGIVSAVAIAVFLYGYATTRNKVLFLDSLISDRAWLPPALTLAAGFLECFLMLQLRELHRWDGLAMRLHILLCAAMLILGGFITHSFWFYAMILFNYALTIGVLVRGMRLHNKYVSRPVPFFGKEDEAV